LTNVPGSLISCCSWFFVRELREFPRIKAARSERAAFFRGYPFFPWRGNGDEVLGVFRMSRIRPQRLSSIQYRLRLIRNVITSTPSLPVRFFRAFRGPAGGLCSNSVDFCHKINTNKCRMFSERRINFFYLFDFFDLAVKIKRSSNYAN
jgi:hypothetical protein